MSLRVIFMGTPDFAVPTLTEIIGQGHEVVSVYTRAPAPAGRGMELRPSPVQVTAERFGIPVFSPKTLKTAEAAEIMASHQADVAVVVAYGLILPKAILEVPGSAASISTPRCCRAGAVRRRSSAPSWPAIPRPVSA